MHDRGEVRNRENTMIKQSLKEAVCSETLSCWREKLFAGTSGNLSCYEREDDLIYITPGSFPYDLMKPEDIMVIRPDGTIADGPHRPSSEWRLHAEIYRSMKDVSAVVHTHSPYATALAVSHTAIPVILIEMVPFLGGDVPVAEFALPGTEAVGRNAVEAMMKDGRNACLMANHGVCAVGGSLAQAHIRATYTEDAAKIYCHALSSGLPAVLIREEDIQAMKEQ